MPSIYRPRRPRASPLRQIVHHGWASFLAEYETVHRPIHGPLRPDAVAVVEHFYHCGELELDLGDGRLLILDGDPMPEDELPLFSVSVQPGPSSQAVELE